MYPVMESFHTIQGEGAFTGVNAYFIRLGGCDVGCHWCDVKESWPVEDHPVLSASEIIGKVNEVSAEVVVITGGEPAMYDLGPLTQGLRESGKKTHIETSGAYAYSGVWNWVCLSPKKFKQPLDEWYAHANELKIIVYNKSDLDWAEENAKQVNAACKLYLQPEWEKREEMMPLIVDYVKNNPKWIISLQTHKYLNIP